MEQIKRESLSSESDDASEVIEVIFNRRDSSPAFETLDCGWTIAEVKDIVSSKVLNIPTGHIGLRINQRDLEDQLTVQHYLEHGPIYTLTSVQVLSAHPDQNCGLCARIFAEKIGDQVPSKLDKALKAITVRVKQLSRIFKKDRSA